MADPHFTPETVCNSIRAYATQRGYVITRQLGLPLDSLPDLYWLFDLASSESPHKPQVRIFWTPLPVESLTDSHFLAARTAIHDRTIPFASFTHDGEHFRTISTAGSGKGSLWFVPRALNGPKRASTFRSLSDLRPFLTIYELRRLISHLSDSIFATYGHDRLKLFDTMLLLMAAKIYDEIEHPDSLHLPRILEDEGVALQDRFRSFCQNALSSMNCAAFGTNLYLDANTLRDSLEMLAPYSFRLTTDIGAQAEILGTFYQEVVSSTFRGSLGAYFTPKPIADLATAICEPTPWDTILDTSCGSGTFLLSAFLRARRDNGEGPTLFGCDIQERMVLTTVLNSFLHGVYCPHIIHGDALQINLQEWRKIDPAVPQEGFSLIVGNPPFAGFESGNYLPYHPTSPKTQRGAGSRVNKVIPFIAKTVQLLRPGGRAALVVPASVLNGEAASFADLRRWLATEVYVTAILGLPREAFVHTDCGVEGALLFFERKGGSAPTHVFFRNLSNLGYDRRGRPVPGSEVDDTLSLWKKRENGAGCWITLEDLYGLERWDATWLQGHVAGMTRPLEQTHIRLTELCSVVKRQLGKQDIRPDGVYRYFEVGDTDINTGTIDHVHTVSGRDLPAKSRLQIPVQEGDILLPNHRDSLIAKTANGIGRSAVLVTDRESGCITTNRFTVLRPREGVPPKLLIFLLNSPVVRQQLFLHARGSASFDVRDKVLERVWVPRTVLTDRAFQQEVLATLEERDRIQQHLRAIDKQLAQLMEKLKV